MRIGWLAFIQLTYQLKFFSLELMALVTHLAVVAAHGCQYQDLGRVFSMLHIVTYA